MNMECQVCYRDFDKDELKEYPTQMVKEGYSRIGTIITYEGEMMYICNECERNVLAGLGIFNIEG